MNSKTITMHAGGTGEREQAIDNITVPDLWHVATRLRAAENLTDAQMVMDCWHLAHAMKDALQAPTTREPEPASVSLDLLADIIRDAHDNHTDHAPLIHVQQQLFDSIEDDAEWRRFTRRCTQAPQ